MQNREEMLHIRPDVLMKQVEVEAMLSTSWREVEVQPGQTVSLPYEPWQEIKGEERVDLIRQSVEVVEAGVTLPNECLTSLSKCIEHAKLGWQLEHDKNPNDSALLIPLHQVINLELRLAGALHPY